MSHTSTTTTRPNPAPAAPTPPVKTALRRVFTEPAFLEQVIAFSLLQSGGSASAVALCR